MVSPITIVSIPGFTQSAVSDDVLAQYRDTVRELKDYLTMDNFTDGQIENVEFLINKLKGFLVNGLSVTPDAAHPNGVGYLSTEMAQQLTLLFESLRLGGYSINNTPINMSIEHLMTEQNNPYPETYRLKFYTWKGLVNTSNVLDSLFNFASVQYRFERSIQAMVELDYVKTGNDLLSGQISSLDSALSTTKTSLDSLASLQNLHNQVYVDSKGSFTTVMGFNWNPTTPANTDPHAASAFAYSTGGYGKAASAFFGQPIIPGVARTGDPASYQLSVWQISEIMAAQQGAASITPLFSLDNVGGGFVMNTTTLDHAIYDNIYNSYSGINYYTNTGAFPVSVDTQGGGSILLAGGKTVIYQVGSSNLYNDFKACRDAYYGSTGLNLTGNPPTITLPLGSVEANNFVHRVLLYGYANPLYSVGHLRSTFAELVRVRNAISAQIAALSLITPLVSGQTDPDSLLAKLRIVLADISAIVKTNTGGRIESGMLLGQAISGLTRWLMDGYNLRNTASASLAGKIQQNITFAITAGQSLNDQQKEQVRRFLYVFEEFYKSASAILQQITQILQRMAQAISR